MRRYLMQLISSYVTFTDVNLTISRAGISLKLRKRQFFLVVLLAINTEKLLTIRQLWHFSADLVAIVLDS